jgi:hypothetical protein
MNKPKDFWLKIDSMIHNCYDLNELPYSTQIPPDLKAPKNSDVSSDNLSIGSHSSVEEKKEPMIQEAKKKEVIKVKAFDKTLVDL